MALAAGFMIGCAAPAPPGGLGDEPPAQNEQAGNGRGRAELWGQRCTQCHWARGPDTFSRDQWGIIMFHMRVRANLTPAEHDAILDFLSSAN
jgi:hypothetical protein